ncbi:MAG TPA: GNAT family N-acetyltransferase [Pyrinomonadaceae bacterium]|nr:GNAT family N-acetyltransferase [Pyrinomonadaceae bacterium]
MRMFRESDAAAYAEICADPEVMKYLADGKPMNAFEAWRSMAFHVGHWELLGYGHFATEEKSSGRLIGRIGFLNPAGWPDFEIGWTIAREFWGRGYATEAARRALKYAFEDLDRDHVISLIDPENKASIRVAERLGEKVEGTTELFGKHILIYGLDRADWLKQDPAAQPAK